MAHTGAPVEPSVVHDLLAAAAPPDVLQVVLDAAVCRLPADQCAIALDSNGELETVATAGDTALDGPGRRCGSALDHRSIVYHEGNSCLVADLTDTRRTTVESTGGAKSPRQERVRSLLCVPLGEIGILTAEATATGAFTERDRSWLEQLATYASSALDRFQLERFQSERVQSSIATNQSATNQTDAPGRPTDLDAPERPTDLDDRVSFVLNATGSVLWEIDITDESLRMYGPVNRSYSITPGRRYDFQQFIDEYIHPDDQASVRGKLEAVVRGETDEIAVEYRIQGHGTEKTRWFRSRAALTDRGGGVLIGLSTHITDQKRREQKIKGLQRRTAGLIRADSPEEIAQVAVDASGEALTLPLSGVYLDDGEGTLEPVAVSEAVHEVHGSPPAYRNDSGDPIDSFVWDVFECGELQVIEDTSEFERLGTRTDIKSGIIHPLDEYGVFITSSPEPNAFDDADVALGEVMAASMIAALDRADQKQRLREQATALERKNGRLEEFTTIVSHDLRNPLNVALGRIEYLRSQHGGEHLETAERALERMATIINETLVLARQGERVDSRSPVALREMIEQCWQNVDTEAATLEIEFAGDSGPTVQADRERLAHVFENLFRNAVEHGSTSPRSQAHEDAVEHGSTNPDSRTRQDTSKDGDPAVRIRIGTLDGDGIYVEDDGPGIPDDERDDVFDIGYTTSESGTGFGLPLVQDIVEAHDWEISVTEGRMGGARFQITGLE